MSWPDTLIKAVLEWRTENSTQRKEAASRAIEAVFRLMDELVNEDDITSERAAWIQSQLRSVYERVSEIAEAGASRNDFDPPADLLANAIAAARMYFWIRTFDGEQTLDGLTRDKLTAMVVEADEKLTRSYSAAVWLMLRKMLGNEELGPWHRQTAKQDTLRAMADAKSVLLKFLC